MMAQPGAEVEQQTALQAVLESYYAQCADSGAMQKIRAKAWDQFLELGLPDKQNEVFRYLRLRSFYAQNYVMSAALDISAKDIATYIFPECTQSVLVFVNGHYKVQLSNTQAFAKRAVIAPLSEAIRTYGTFLNNHWSRLLKDESDPFAVLNVALQRDGAFLYLPPNTVFEKPVQILNVIDTKNENMMIFPSLHVFAGAQSEISLVNSLAHLSGSKYCLNQLTDFAIEDSAHVHLTQVAVDVAAEAWHFDAVRATLKRNCTFKTVAVTRGSATVRNDYRITLTGENSEALLNGLWFLADKREAHTHVLIDHQAPNCHSLQLFKGVLDDFSHSSFEGKILVRQAAQKTNAFQLNNNLLLSDRTMAESKPNLEIFADDVKASHGATMGQLDGEALFYLKTRGFTAAQAKNILVYGYCKEVIDLIKVPSLLGVIDKQSKKYLM